MYVNPPPSGVTGFSGFILHLYSSSRNIRGFSHGISAWKRNLLHRGYYSSDEEKMLRSKPEACWMQR